MNGQYISIGPKKAISVNLYKGEGLVSLRKCYVVKKINTNENHKNWEIKKELWSEVLSVRIGCAQGRIANKKTKIHKKSTQIFKL